MQINVIHIYSIQNVKLGHTYLSPNIDEIKRQTTSLRIQMKNNMELPDNNVLLNKVFLVKNYIRYNYFKIPGIKRKLIEK